MVATFHGCSKAAQRAENLVRRPVIQAWDLFDSAYIPPPPGKKQEL